MAGQSDKVRRWKYTCDNGQTYRLRAKTAIVAQVDGALAPKVGGEAASMADPLPPKGFRPRVAYVTDGTGLTRQVVCYDTSCALFATDGTTINLQLDGAETAFTGNKHNRSEHNPRGIADNA